MEKGKIFLVIGLVLILIDSFAMTFFLFPVGIAFVVGSILWYLYPSFYSFGIGFLFGLISASLVSFKIAKRVKGLNPNFYDLLDQEGIIVKRVGSNEYLVRFPLGAGGEEVWLGYSNDDLKYGDRVAVERIEGNKIIIKKVEREGGV